MNEIELLSIEEEDDSLMLRAQRRNVGLAPPLGYGTLAMRLVDCGRRAVRFERVSDCGIASLGFCRPADDQLVMSIETVDNHQETEITLDAVR